MIHDLEHGFDASQSTLRHGLHGSAWGSIEIQVLRSIRAPQRVELAISELTVRGTNFDGL